MRAAWRRAAGVLLAAAVLAGAALAGSPRDALAEPGADAQAHHAGFDRPAFAPGALHGQDGWLNPDGAALIASGRTATGASDRDRLTVVVDGRRLPPAAPGTVATRMSRPIGLDGLADGTPIVEIAVDVALTGPSTDEGEGPADNLVSAGVTAMPAEGAPTAAGFGALALSSSGEVWIIGSRPQDAFRIGLPVSLDRSHRLALRLDFSRRTTQFFVDGAPVARLPFARSIRSNTLAAAPLAMTAADRPGLAAAYTAVFAAYQVSAYKPVAVDVEPGLCPNRRDRGARTSLSVALPGSAEFDPVDADPASLRLIIGAARVGIVPREWTYADIATAYEPHTGKERPDACTPQGADGYTDLVVSFDGGAVAEALAGAAGGDVRLFRLTGRLIPGLDQTPITGEDVVRLR
jgi:hypothetical protein